MIQILMKEDIESALRNIEEDYNTCFRMIRRIYDYLEKFGVKEFNKYSTYKWSLDKDKIKSFSYVCIRYGSSLKNKCAIKRRSHMESNELYRWVEKKDLIEEALNEAYDYITERVSAVKFKIEGLKETARDIEQKLDAVSQEYDEEIKAAKKVLRGVTFDD